DNASNNDTCLQTLAKEFNFNFNTSRLRYIRHIINLIARLIIFRADPNAFKATLLIDLEDIKA
ncbi:uncharacterized protein M437DRAFT_45652, partial [Aureobasidium melanogenum CBS 110374]